MDEYSPLSTEYTRKLGIPEEVLNKLHAIRSWDIEGVRAGSAEPIPFKWPEKYLRREIITSRGTSLLVLKQYQLQAVHQLTRMPRIMLGLAVGLGKAQPLDAKILTPTGWTTMGALKVGDEIVDPDGGTGFVEAIYPQGEKDVYRLSTKDRASTECCEDHLWTIQTIEDRQRNKFRTLSVRQMLDKGLFGIKNPTKNSWRTNRFFLPKIKPTEFIPLVDKLPIKPYTLGVLLGDGCLRTGVGFSSIDEEIIDRLKSELPKNLCMKHISGCDWTINDASALQKILAWNGKTAAKRHRGEKFVRPKNTYNSYRYELMKLGLMGKYSYEKHIPEIYLRASVEDRIALLQGLMDTDGEFGKGYGSNFSSTSEQLARDITELIRSLGGQVRMRKSSLGKYKLPNGEYRICKQNWSLLIKTDFPPFHLSRKRVLWETKKSMFARAIVNIEPSGRKICQCISVSTKRNLYVTDDYLPTHNTISALAAFCRLKQGQPSLKLIVLTTKSTTMQWADEIEKFSYLRPFVMVDSYKGMSSNAARLQQVKDFLEGDKKDVLICKYTSLIGKRKALEGQFDQEGNPITAGKESVSQDVVDLCNIMAPHKAKIVLVLDEAQKFKNQDAVIRKMVGRISRRSSKVWALSGTFIKNGIEEFYSIANAIGIEPFGWMGDFYEEFCNMRSVHVGRGRYIKQISGYKNVAKFKAGIRPFFFGRSQKQVKEPLPQLVTKYHQVELSKQQAKLLLRDIPQGTYHLPPRVVREAGLAVHHDRDPDNMMTMLSVYQLVANHPGLLDPDNPAVFYDKKLSPKEEELLELLDETLEGENVIVYSKFRSHIDRLEKLTKDGDFTKRKFLRITGNENEKQREINKKLFQETDEHNLIFINNAGLEGINLQEAAHMVVLDLPWSFGDLLQLVGRMIRIASPNSTCTLHVLTAKGTIDEYTLAVLQGKKGVFELILGESHSAGLLDNKLDIDLSSGMDEVENEREFASLLKAYVKNTPMSEFLKGAKLVESIKQGDNYVMDHEISKVSSYKEEKFEW